MRSISRRAWMTGAAAVSGPALLRAREVAAQIAADDGAPGTVLDRQLTIACGAGAIRPRLVQRAGRGAMAPDALLRGFVIPPGTRL